MLVSSSCGHRALFKDRPDRGEAAKVKLTQHSQDLSIENRRPGRSAHCIVREQSELPVEDRAGTKASDGGCHAVASIKIELRLWARLAIEISDRMQRRRRQMQALMAPAAQRLEALPRVQNLITRRRLAQLHAYALRVAFQHRHAIAHRRNSQVRELEATGIVALNAQPTEKLGNLFLQLLFFVLDVRNHVPEDVKRCNPGITRTGNRLHRRDKELLNPKALMQRRERKHKTNRAAVRIRDQIAT